MTSSSSNNHDKTITSSGSRSKLMATTGSNHRIDNTSSSGSDTRLAGVISGGSGDHHASLSLPITRDALSFDGRQSLRLKDIEKKYEDDVRREKKKWEKEVDRMREEFLRLLPVDKTWGSDELLDDQLIAKRRGSTDVLNAKKMKTMFMEYPNEGRRFRLRFDVSDFDPKSVQVSVEGERIMVRATKVEQPLMDNSRPEDEEKGVGAGDLVQPSENESGASGGGPKGDFREYVRKIEKPKEIDLKKLKVFLTSDSILIIEAPLPPHTLNLWKLSHSPSHSSQCSSKSRSPSGSPKTPSSSSLLTKLGVPSFHERDGVRYMSLVVELGSQYKPKDVMVQVVKDNRVLVKAKHEERTSERMLKSKFHKEYELPEKIDTHSLRGGLAEDGRLIIGALAKGQSEGMSKREAGELATKDINSYRVSNCNVLDLASFPPTSSQMSSSFHG